jgi:hypothetical protein
LLSHAIRSFRAAFPLVSLTLGGAPQQ